MRDPEFYFEWFTEAVHAVRVRSEYLNPLDIGDARALLRRTDIGWCCCSLGQIRRESIRHGAVDRNTARIEEQRTVGHLANCREIVANQQHRPPLA